MLLLFLLSIDDFAARSLIGLCMLSLAHCDYFGVMIDELCIFHNTFRYLCMNMKAG